MPRNSSVRKDFIKAIHKVKYARLLNFQPFLSNSKNLPTTFVAPYRLFSWAAGELKETDDKLIRPIKMVGRDVAKANKRDRFYCLTKAGADYIGVADHYSAGEKRMSLVDHETAKVDVMLSFIFNFPNYEIDIQYEQIFDGYKPDAIVRLWDLTDCTKSYDFVVEIERSRKPEAIKKEKLYKIAKVRFNGLSTNHKILFVIAHPHFLIDRRPLEYTSEDMDMNNDYLQHVINLSRGLPAHRYRFMAYHDFPNINKVVWHTPDKKRVAIINQ
jgi:hypothetical protein